MLISVIVPTCFRSNRLLERSIDSILYFQNTNVEVVVVNDNKDIDIFNCKELHSKYKGLAVVYSNNNGVKGAAGARNYGVSLAKGELISFLDDDDFILPGRLAQMKDKYDELNATNSDVALISTGRINEYESYKEIEVVPKQKFGLLTLTDINLHNDIDIGFMISKAMFERIGGFDTRFHNLEDWDFIIRVLKLKSAYKIRSYSYVVKNDLHDKRVSNNDYIGLRQINEKHNQFFGESWSRKIEAQALRSECKLGFLKSLLFFLEFRDTYFLRQFIGAKKQKIQKKSRSCGLIR